MVQLLADLGALGNYPSSPFLPSDSDILLDSPEQDDIGKQTVSKLFRGVNHLSENDEN